MILSRTILYTFPGICYANGEAENFYADNGVYYVINNNSGYEGDLEIALVTTDFATDILGETLDEKGVLVERNDAELTEFAIAFENLFSQGICGIIKEIK